MSDDPPFRLRSLAVPAFGPTLLFSVGEGAILPVIPMSARELGASLAVAAMMTTILGLGSLVSNIPASYITARWRERWAIVGGSVAAIAGLLCCLYARQIWVYATGIAFLGAATAVFNLARQKYLTEAVPLAYRARMLSTLAGMMRVGYFVGPFLGALVMAWLHVEGAYWVAVVFMAFAAVVGWRMPDAPACAAKEAGAGEKIRWMPVVRAHRKVFLTVGVGVGLLTVVRMCRQAAIPLWADVIHVSPSATSVIYGVAAAVDMLVFYPAGRVMDRRGRPWVAVPALLIMGVGMALLPLTSTAFGLLMVAIVLSLGNGLSAGLQMTLGADYSPARGRAQFLGVWRLVGDVGSVSGPALLSALTGVLGLASGFFVIGGVGVLAAGIFGYFLPRASRPDRG